MRNIPESPRTPRSRKSSPRKDILEETAREDSISQRDGSVIKKRRKVAMRRIESNPLRGKIISIPAATLRDIRRLQRTDKLLIPKVSFSRLIREIVQEQWGDHIRFHRMAMQCLQEASETNMSLWFTKLNYLAGHAKRVTVTVPDSQLKEMLDRIPC